MTDNSSESIKNILTSGARDETGKQEEEKGKLEPTGRLEADMRRLESIPCERRKSIDIIFESEHKPDTIIPQQR